MGRLRQGPDSEASSIVQTLDRGITALEIIAYSVEPVDVATVADSMGVGKSVAYRLIRTLEARNLVRRTSNSQYEPSLYLGRLGAKSYRPLQAAAAPQMKKLAKALGHTVYMAIPEGDEMVTVWVETPADPDTIAYRPSARHPMGRGATWVAWTAAHSSGPEDTRDVLKARQTGFAMTTSEVIPGLSAVASPIVASTGEAVGVLAAIFLNRSVDIGFVSRKVLVSAEVIGDELG